ncbi:hypothetical protein HK101_000776 [Irineochytrium annulatum]|nr:hypothetical protein HK101_000776 [Irineochytrium annulatum]
MDTLERATLCCLHIMLRYPHVELEVQSPTLVRHRTRKDKEDYMSSDSALKSGSRLSLHVAITIGSIDHVIVGTPNERMDYFIDGDCMDTLKNVVDHAKSGELGLSSGAWSLLQKHHKETANVVPRVSDSDVTFASGQLEVLHDSMLSADAFSRTSTVRKGFTGGAIIGDSEYATKVIAGHKGIAKAAPLAAVVEGDADDGLLNTFVNQSIVYKLKQRKTLSADDATAVNDMRSDIKGEFRRVSAVFVKIYNHSDAQKSQSIMSILLQSLKKNGGVFQQYADALNALRASVEFATAIEKSNLGPVAVAVATGDVMFTSFGSSYRIDASFLGDVINVAARLLTVAHLAVPGDVLCETETRSSAHGLTFAELGEHRVKGKLLPIAVYSVNADAFKMYDQLSRKATLKVVGYHDEHAALDDAFHGWLRHDAGRTCVIEGASGMGKSMMLKYMKEKAASESRVKCCVVQGTEMEKSSPYSSIGAVIAYIYAQYSDTSLKIGRHGSGIERSTSYLSTHERSARRMSVAQLSRGRINEPDIHGFLRQYDVYSEFAPLLKLALPWLRIPDNDSTRSLSSKTKKVLLEPMLLKIVSGFVRMKKVVFLFDDAQWLDTISLEVIQHLTASCSKGLFLFFTRQIAGNPNIESMVARPSTAKLHLQGLTKEDITELILQFFRDEGAVKVDEELQSAVFKGSNGSPLVIDLLFNSTRLLSLYQINSDGLLSFSANAHKVLASMARTVESAITVQFDRLNPTFQDILRQSSVLGASFRLEELAMFIGCEDDLQDFESTISTHDIYHFLVHEDGGEVEDNQHYVFRSTAIKDVIYDSQSFADRSRLHEKAAAMYESSFNENNRELLLPIALFHYSRSSNTVKYANCLEEMGALYLDKYSTAEAIASLTTLIDLNSSESTPIADTTRLALWHSMRASAHAQKISMNQVREDTSSAMKCLDLDWPATTGQTTALCKAMLKQLVLEIATRGGRAKYRPGRRESAEQTKILYNIAANMFLCSAYNPHNYTSRQKMLISFWFVSFSLVCRLLQTIYENIPTRCLNAAVKQASEQETEWAATCIKSACVFVWTSKFLSRIYLKKGLVGIDPKKSPGTWLGIYYMEHERDFKHAEEEVFVQLEEAKRICNPSVECIAIYFHSLIQWYRGDTGLLVTLNQIAASTQKFEFITPLMCWVSIFKIGLLTLDTALMSEKLASIDFWVNILATSPAPSLYFMKANLMCRAVMSVLVNPNPQHALMCFVEMEKLLPIWTSYSYSMTEGSLIGMMAIFFMIEKFVPLSPSRDANKVHQEMPFALSPDEVKTLASTVSKITAFLKILATKRHQGSAGIGWRLFQIADALLTRPNNSRGGVAVMRKVLYHSELSHLLPTDLKFVGAFVQSLIGIYSSRATERQSHLKSAVDFYREKGATFFEGWASGHLAQAF